MQTDFGRLAACFSTSGESFCVVQILEHMDCFGDQLYNEYDCPLLTLTPCPSFHCVFYHCNSHSVSLHMNAPLHAYLEKIHLHPLLKGNLLSHAVNYASTMTFQTIYML